MAMPRISNSLLHSLIFFVLMGEVDIDDYQVTR